jgi:hypothetical protein
LVGVVVGPVAEVGAAPAGAASSRAAHAETKIVEAALRDLMRG